jgi:DinB superfamily
MMNSNEILKRTSEHTVRYLEEIESLDMEQLTRKESVEDWSLGQMYIHLINAALYMQLQSVEACISETPETTVVNAEKTEVGETIFAQGAIPPIRIQVPASPQYTPPQPESKAQIVSGFHTVLQRMEEILPRLESSSSRHKALHPAFGALDAKEWFALVEMHYRHHFLQQERLKKALPAVGA